MTLRDVDAGARGRIVKAAAWSAFAGVFMGGALAFSGVLGLVGAAAVALGVVVLGVAFAESVAALAGGVTRHLTDPSTGLRPKGLSRAESLRARGEFDLAIDELTRLIAEHPDDPDAYLLMDRTYRDDLREPGKAAMWFRRTLDVATLSPSLAALVERELAEVKARMRDTHP